MPNWRRAYENPETGLREDVYASWSKGEFFADVTVVNGSGASRRGFVDVSYVKKPRILAVKGRIYPIEGEKMSYRCPPSGWAVPADGHLWHPEIGAAIATVPERSEAIKGLAGYFERTWDRIQFRNIPGNYYYYYLKRIFDSRGIKVDPENLTPEQLAEVEVSHHSQPAYNLGAVRRLSASDNMHVLNMEMGTGFNYRSRCTGARAGLQAQQGFNALLG